MGTVEDPRQLNRSLSQCPFLLERRGWQWGILIEDGNGRKGPSFLYRRILYSAPDPSLICPRRWTQLHWKQQQCNTKYTRLFHTAVILHIGWRSIMRNRRGRHRASSSHRADTGPSGSQGQESDCDTTRGRGRLATGEEDSWIHNYHILGEAAVVWVNVYFKDWWRQSNWSSIKEKDVG